MAEPPQGWHRVGRRLMPPWHVRLRCFVRGHAWRKPPGAGKVALYCSRCLHVEHWPDPPPLVVKPSGRYDSTRPPPRL
jgi:hypothetical protein